MKKYNYTLLLSIILLMTGLSSCEKDDLCDPSLSVTPRLIIKFTDIGNPEESKEVEQLQIREIGFTEFAPLDSEGSTLLTAVDSIAIPLRTDSNNTSYEFFLDDDDGTNIDSIDFNYNLDEIYINRACGFKIVYNELGAFRLPEPTGDEWIINIQVVTPEVTSNNDIHIEIRH
ncbi:MULTISPECIES: DUF6452 family protein [Nonlabens]|uniref:Lipoprotein n=1 Tax=Nonlabens ulvanivorans TaxID=906888 RepID=A0A081DDQ2_NONUL|nr:DUF6452 family protein [Nonlabens ulvanivorans]KEZ93878.1 hypothetical protein IL45_06685 [Nonlabens ulvanivorans]PRX14486.1 hypothetical protein LY02_01517 [Nonlabens ulvanivorans]WOI22975.1 DUF6452 family protein [Nonlabens ulvanivorans]GAK77048.1 hypothetical protein JCM19296_2652 [Nonlabens ulvanivorans]GAL00925.1 hypothetical protein JCM19314_151 [Nonlabens ulvanivorans]